MRTTPKVNAGSMADIAFTLLIFFLVSTTMATDKGQRVRLPAYIDCPYMDCSEDISDWNVLALEVLPDEKLLLEGGEFDIRELKNETITFLLNNGKNPNYSDSYKRAVVLIKTDANADYENYLEVYSNVKAAFTQIRNTEAMRQYQKRYEYLDDSQARDIRTQFPLKIYEDTVE